MNKKKILIIGAGPGGLTAGMILAHRGYDIEIFEKEAVPGGRNAPIHLQGYTFDTGPTFLMMNFVLEEVFQLAGRNLSDLVTVKKLDPMYRLNFGDLEFLPTSDHVEMKKRIAKLFPGNEQGYEQFLAKVRLQYDKMYPCLKTDYSTVGKLFSANLRKAVPYLQLGRSLYDYLGSFFKAEKLKLSFTFQSKYLGMSPWDCPAAFTMIPYVEHEFGIYHVIGGLNKISEAMSKVVQEEGGKIHYQTSVRNLIVEEGKVKGVLLANGEKVLADQVIINADFGYSMTNLVDNNILRKYARKKLEKKQFSCSTFMLYLGLDKKYQIPHHNIFFAKDYKWNIDDIFKTKKLSDDISFYVQNAAVTDTTLAPAGCSTIYVLVPVPNNTSGIDWEKEKKGLRDRVMDNLARRTEMKDIREHIKVEKVITPADWESTYHVYFGATFNLAHNLGQMLYFRPHNKFEELENCYLVGGGTHPGSGLPTIYESARISADMISKKYGA